MLSIISLVAYVVTKLAVGIFAGGIVFYTLLPELRLDLGFVVLDAFWIGSVVVVVLTGLYTVLGGLRAVAYTDTLQTLIFIVGSAMVTVFGLIELGGWDSLREQCGSEMFNLWRPLVPAGMEGTWEPVRETGRMAWYFSADHHFPWLRMLVCAPIVGLWYWCTDRYIVQRALAASNETIARRGSIVAAFMKLLPVALFIIRDDLLRVGQRRPSRARWLGRRWRTGSGPVPGGVPVDGQACPAGRSSGVVVAGLLSGLDELIGRRLTPVRRCSRWICTRSSGPRPQSQLVWIGRLATSVMVLIALLWIP